MRVLLDNNMPKVLRKLIRGHLVIHVFDQGWATMPDHLLLRQAEDAGFDLLITNDKKIFKQQNNSIRKIALLEVSTNSRKRIRDAHERIFLAVERARPGSYEKMNLDRPND